MPLQKQSIPVPLSLGLDQKTDPWQVVPGKFLKLTNYVFNKGKRLTKRNGFAKITTLPVGASATTITTFNGNLTAIGTNLYAYTSSNGQWLNTGRIQPVQLSIAPVVRTATSQMAQDAALSQGNVVCTVFLDQGTYKYQIVDNNTNQVLVNITSLPSGANVPRVFLLGSYFIITYLVTVAATPHLRYISIPLANLDSPASPVDISTQVRSTTTSGYDGVLANNILYLAWDASDGGGAIRTAYLTSTLAQANGDTSPGHTANLLSVSVDTTTTLPTIWVSIWDSGSTNGYTAAFSQSLNNILPFTQFLTTTTILELTAVAQNNINYPIYEIVNTYGYSAVRTDYLQYNTVTLSGTVGGPTIIERSVGLASKAFILGGNTYMLASYAGAFQPTYFLIDLNGSIVAKVAYSNGNGYLTTQVLPNVSIQGNLASIGYLLKDLLTTVNKVQGAASSSGVYSQTGINLVTFDLSSEKPLITAEIGGSLYVAGGILWQYDGFKPVEQGFNVWPEDILLTGSAVGGLLEDQQYFYQVVYEWTDGAGNINRSAPSVPQTITTSGGNTSSVTLNIPTLRLTYKFGTNVVRIVIYRWSVNQQSYYQVTSVSSPLLNNTTVDSVTFVDTLADSSIIGNALIYTTGGVIENIGAPACSTIALSQNRLMLIDAEDRNLLWFSKTVIEATPVEMSDLFTLYVAPTTGSQGSTGPSYALSPMDDKTIIFKQDASYYFTGIGPDNTGSNSDFSAATYITSSIGTTNQLSVVLMPSGIIVETDKGRWKLGRDLGTSYIGADVENSNAIISNSALTVPGTNQVRLILDNSTMLMYDYYYGQWGEFSNIGAIAGTLYNSSHTYLNNLGEIYQESPGIYLDGSRPVLGSFTTSWFNLMGLQGLQRLYYFYLLGQYYSPHIAYMGIAYDYNPSLSQNVLLQPDNFSAPYGGPPSTFYGDDSPYGGPGDVEQFRVFPSIQKCQAFQLTFQETFDPSFGVTPGQGLSLSGLNLIVGMKKGYPTLAAAKSAS